MKALRFLSLFFLINLLLACSDERIIFEEHQTVGDEYEWHKNEIKTFRIDVQENKHPLKMTLHFRCASGYYFDKVLLKMRETSPEGEVITRDIEVPVRNEDGEFIGDKGFDIIDLAYVLDEKKTYPTFGIYTYEIWQDMPDVDPLDFVMEIGLSLSDKKQ